MKHGDFPVRYVTVYRRVFPLDKKTVLLDLFVEDSTVLTLWQIDAMSTSTQNGSGLELHVKVKWTLGSTDSNNSKVLGDKH